MTIKFPLTVDMDNPKVVRDQDGLFIMECGDTDISAMAMECINYVVSLPDPPDDWEPEVN